MARARSSPEESVSGERAGEREARKVRSTSTESLRVDRNRGALMEIFELEEGHLGYWATGSGTPVLFVHGVATLGELWAADLAPLASDCRIIAYEGDDGPGAVADDDRRCCVQSLHESDRVVRVDLPAEW